MARVQSPLSNMQGLCIAVIGCIRCKGAEDGQERFESGLVGVDSCGKLSGGGRNRFQEAGVIYQRNDTTRIG